MATDSVAAGPTPLGAAPASIVVPDKGLKRNAIGFLSNVVIGVASTAPAYSLAATLGFIIAEEGIGTHAPAVLLASFVPMVLVALGYRYMNRADPDAGTTFAWTTRAFGPGFGWVNGWAIFLADLLVMASLAYIAAIYSFKLVEWGWAETHTGAALVGAILWILLMTWICHRGIELSARVQQILLSFEFVMLMVFAIVALVKVYTGHPAGSIQPQASWFNPFAMPFHDLLVAMLLGIFLYWGWDSGVAVNEESEASADGPGRAAVMSTILLVLIYVVVSAASQAYAGTKFLTDNSDDVLSVLGNKVFGDPWNKLLIIAVLTSASASTQTTILPTARTTLSMARFRAIPEAFGRIHPRFLTPSTSTLAMGAVSAIWTILVLALNPAQNVLGDSITALGFGICFYYGLTAFACVVYFRREIFKSARNFIFVGLVPLLGGLMLLGIFIKALTHYSQNKEAGELINYAKPIAGIEVPIAIGIGSLLLGVVVMFFAWAKYKEFFRRKPEAAPEGTLEAPVEHAAAHL